MKQLINLLNKNARMPICDIAKTLNISVEDVNLEIKKLEEKGIIAGYAPIINWEKAEIDNVTAIVEVKFSLNNKIGFEELSTSIANMPEVDSVYLMSGGYDLAVTIKGKSIQEIAFFVNEKLSTMDCVLSTGTHFVLKSYKERGFRTQNAIIDKRGAY